MGFIQAFTGSIGGTFADQWKDFLQPVPDVPGTAALFPAVAVGQNAGRGSNTKGSTNIISNGSKILIPEGTALITVQDGMITGFVGQPGGYIFQSDDINAKSFFSGDGIIESVVKQSWERFKFGGQPGSNHAAFYVNMKEIPGLRFGTQSEIYWDDAYLGAQVGAITRGSYSMKIVDPIVFIKQFVPMDYINSCKIFDFDDMNNPANDQLFTELVGSLSAAFSMYTNDPSMGNRINKIQADQIGFAQSLSAAVEEGYRWKSDRGLEIVKVALAAIEYDADTKALLSDVKKADALSGSRGNSFMQQSVARGFQAAGENPNGGGALGMGFMGMGMGAVGGAAGGLQQPVNPNPGYAQIPQPQGAPGQAGYGQPAPAYGQPAPGAPVQYDQYGNPIMNGVPGAPAPAPAPAEDPYAKLASLKQLCDQGVISQEEFNAAKAKVLGGI